MAKNDLTAARLRERLIYDPETGVLTWRVVTRNGRRRPGDLAGNLSLSLGYVFVGIDGACYLAHRLAWLYVTGAWPIHDIDHINGTRNDNRIVNLRDVPTRHNLENQRCPQVGRRWFGVTPSDGKWRARIKVRGETLSLGRFGTPEEAQAAYWEAKRRLHAGCTV